MKFFKYLIPAVLLCVLQPDARADSPGVRRLSRRQLQQENARLSKQLDSLQAVIGRYRDSLSRDSSVIAEATVPRPAGEQETRRDGRQFRDATDSLLNVWYSRRSKVNMNEGNGYNMDSVHFSSNVPDSVFLSRLARLNSFITLPYNETVRNFIILYAEKMPTKMGYMLALSKYYFPIFEETFNRYGLPEELKYMAVIESALNPVAVSRARAKGMWQFMHTTAKHYGLEINSFVDERMDVVKSADAAARYLKDAYTIFGDWNLAISSYNCGSGNVNKAIRRSGRTDFWSIYEYLPRETRGYVPAFVGAMYAFNYYREHGITPASFELPTHVDTFSVCRMLHFKQINELVGVPMATLEEFNHQYIHGVIPGRPDAPYTLRLPYEYTNAFIEHEDSVYTYKAAEFFSPATLENIQTTAREAETARTVYKVRSGDNLGRIARKHGVSVSDIKHWNKLRSNSLRVGQRLVIYKKGYHPAPKVSGTASKPAGGKSKAETANQSSSFSTYTVKSGDSLYTIARKYPGVTVSDIMAANPGVTKNIKPGLKLKIPSR